MLEKCRGHNISFISPLNSDINSPRLRKKIKEFRPAIAIVIGCPQIMRKELISCFHRIINYHNSILPKSRGIYVTHWARYFSEPTTGYSFHIVNE
jgi:methionyl-tRNA formyltransferase